MKKAFLLIVIIAAVGLFYAYKGHAVTPVVKDNIDVPGREGGFSSPGFETFTIDNSPVTLSNGVSEEKDDVGSVIETKLLDDFVAYGSLNDDHETDMALLLARSGGGSGVFIYLAADVSGPVSRKGTNAIFIGDRIAPQSVSISNGVITLKYLDRAPDEAFSAEPTFPVTKEYIYKNNTLQEK